ncbi:MAG: glycosyltransferase family 2 protein [Nanoarchaeota archaeon]
MNKISIIIPVYNEEKTVEMVVNSVFAVKIPNYEKEIIIVNDASTDNTSRLLKKLKIKHKKLIILNHKINSGKGSAILTASRAVTGKIVVIQDADLEYDPQDIPKLVKCYDAYPGSVVYGSRELKKNDYSYVSYLMGNKLLNFLTNLLYKVNISDMETCYKLLPAEIFRKLDLKSNSFDIEPEITAKVGLMGLKIREVPINYRPRSKKEGKKIRWIDGVIALKVLFLLRFFRRI